MVSCSSPSWAPSSLASFSSLLRLFFLCLWRRWLSPSSLSCCFLSGEQRDKVTSDTALPQQGPRDGNRGFDPHLREPHQQYHAGDFWDASALPHCQCHTHTLPLMHTVTHTLLLTHTVTHTATATLTHCHCTATPGSIHSSTLLFHSRVSSSSSDTAPRLRGGRVLNPRCV